MHRKSLEPPTVAALVAAGLIWANGAVAKVEGDNIVLGAAIALTGELGTKGAHTANGYNLAVKKINQSGGIKVAGKTYRLRIKYYDDESTPDRAARLAERLIRHDGIRFMLGPYGAAATAAVAAVTEKHKIPMVQAAAPDHALFTNGYTHLFSVLSTSEQYLAGAVALAARNAARSGRKPRDLRVALVFGDDPLSLDVRSGAVDEASKFAMKVVASETMTTEAAALVATLVKIAALKPDVLLMSGGSGTAATIDAIEQAKLAVPVVGLTPCPVRGRGKKGRVAGNRIFCPTQWTRTLRYKGALFGTPAQYDKQFKAAFTGYARAPLEAAQASAAVMVWKDGLERAGGFEAEKVRAALAATDLKTFFGPVKFAPQGYNLAKPMALYQVQNGRLNVVAPAKWASHPIQLPGKAGNR
jgi:branched-chain amino acid transport system substrate-binding protein